MWAKHRQTAKPKEPGLLSGSGTIAQSPPWLHSCAGRDPPPPVPKLPSPCGQRVPGLPPQLPKVVPDLLSEAAQDTERVAGEEQRRAGGDGTRVEGKDRCARRHRAAPPQRVPRGCGAEEPTQHPAVTGLTRPLPAKGPSPWHRQRVGCASAGTLGWSRRPGRDPAPAAPVGGSGGAPAATAGHPRQSLPGGAAAGMETDESSPCSLRSSPPSPLSLTYENHWPCSQERPRAALDTHGRAAEAWQGQVEHGGSRKGISSPLPSRGTPSCWAR